MSYAGIKPDAFNWLVGEIQWVCYVTIAMPSAEIPIFSHMESWNRCFDRMAWRLIEKSPDHISDINFNYTEE